MRPILLIFLTTIFLISCGGGGSTAAVNPTQPAASSGSAPTGALPGQIDPVEGT